MFFLRQYACFNRCVIFASRYRTLPAKPPGASFCLLNPPPRWPHFMNTQAVHQSVRLLPPDSAAYGPKTRPLEAHQRWAKATYDPQWAWRVAFGYYQAEEPLPP